MQRRRADGRAATIVGRLVTCKVLCFATYCLSRQIPDCETVVESKKTVLKRRRHGTYHSSFVLGGRYGLRGSPPEQFRYVKAASVDDLVLEASGHSGAVEIGVNDG